MKIKALRDLRHGAQIVPVGMVLEVTPVDGDYYLKHKMAVEIVEEESPRKRRYQTRDMVADPKAVEVTPVVEAAPENPAT